MFEVRDRGHISQTYF
ncbi:Putative required for translation of spoIIID [Bacillus subtilis QB928]|nr:Putative required for translation of spoIIID [Bacillus subtilis QB928]